MVASSKSSVVDNGEGRKESGEKEALCQKGPWGPEEDRWLINFVGNYGEKKWGIIGTELNRTPKSCRLRWFNQLSPKIKHDPFTAEEDDVIIRMVNKRGGKWSQIARVLQCRTDNQVKNRWNSKLKKMHERPPPQEPLAESTQTGDRGAHPDHGLGSISATLRIPASLHDSPAPRPAAVSLDSYMPPGFVAQNSQIYPLAASAPAPAPVFNRLTGLSLCPPGHETDDVLYPHLFPSPYAPVGNWTAMSDVPEFNQPEK